MKKIGVSILASLTTLLPMIAFAAAEFGQAGELATNLSSFITNTLIPLLFTAALLFFLWGVFYYLILGGGDTEKQEQGKQMMLYAIGGFVVMVSIWGIVNLISSGVLGFNGNETVKIPPVPTAN
jgi:hypothetical protein